MTHKAVLSTLVWREWRAHRRGVVAFGLGWLLVWIGWTIVWALVPAEETPHRIEDPEWILLMGWFGAWMAGAVFGGSEAVEGSEEFAFALPPRRGQRFAARLLLGGGLVALLLAADLLAVLGALPIHLADLVGTVHPTFDGGLPSRPELVELGLAVPAALFAVGFGIAACARSRGSAATAHLQAALVVAAARGLGLVIDEEIEGFTTGGWAPSLVLGLLAASALAVAAARYRTKDGLTRSMAEPGGRRGALVVGSVVAAALVLGLGASMVYVTRTRTLAAEREAMQARAHAEEARRLADRERDLARALEAALASRGAEDGAPDEAATDDAGAPSGAADVGPTGDDDGR